MRRLKAIFALAALLLWLPGTMHCPLAAVGVALSDCCEHDASGHDSQDSPPVSSDQDCQGCSVVESGGPVKQAQATVPAPQLTLLWLFAAAEALARPEGSDLLLAGQGQSPPPELPPAWRFLQRAALPPRAPSFAS